MTNAASIRFMGPPASGSYIAMVAALASEQMESGEGLSCSDYKQKRCRTENYVSETL
jgi:hypothetical protein